MALKEAVREISVSKAFQDELFKIREGENFKTCIQCGTCGGICPFGQWMDYSPRAIIGALRTGDFEEVLESDSLWMCVSCFACSGSCPQEAPLTQGLMARIKEELLLAGNVPEELQKALENSQRYENPMGESPRKRAEWT